MLAAAESPAAGTRDHSACHPQHDNNSLCKNDSETSDWPEDTGVELESSGHRSEYRSREARLLENFPPPENSPDNTKRCDLFPAPKVPALFPAEPHPQTVAEFHRSTGRHTFAAVGQRICERPEILVRLRGQGR